KRLKHYFLTYKNLPYEEASCRIDETYGAEYAKKVVEASLKDYQTNYGE
ncbi:inorganic pyrophosphatase, partial [Escherichia coli]|nr:inorganic pyrophosphatase [Escherichia coli]